MARTTLYTTLFLFFPFFIYSQTIRGTVSDAQTKQAIDGATLSIPSKQLFFPTDTHGRFNLSAPQITHSDIVHISCIGYQTKKESVAQLLKQMNIELQPLVMQLKEVRIGLSEIEVGSKASNYDITGSIMPSMDAVLFMKGASGKKGIIKSVGFFVTDGTHGNLNGDVTSPFRVRLFDVDGDGMPGRELTKDIIVVAAKTNNQWFDIDLAHLQIKNPKRGFFVSFSLLTSDYYRLRLGYLPQENLSNSSDFATPRIGITKSEFKEKLSYTRNLDWYGGKWRLDPKTNFMIRSTISLNVEP
ncbi:MAG: carboxypeptidase-like regulatory domain-containing protein [Pedobacter sp.]|nr:MAG: carboxypeptidase-like regulatory domain-containing protein [Pedobacter sp.]